MTSTPFFSVPHVPSVKTRNLYHIYVENAKISQKEYALQVHREEGTTNLPVSQIATVMIGPGSSISSQAIKLCSEMGVTVQWVGAGLVRMYSVAQPIAKSSHFLLKQVELFADPKRRLQVAKAMYQMRFPGEIVSNLSMEQLRGREGARVRKTYSEQAAIYKIDWDKRNSRMKNIAEEDTLNQTLTMATSCLYGVCHSAIVALGLSPGIGFVHTGNIHSFIFDIADLYKTSLIIPLAFEIETLGLDGKALDALVRLKTRNLFYDNKLLLTIIRDLKTLLSLEEAEEEPQEGLLYLWSDHGETVPSRNYGDEEGWK